MIYHRLVILVCLVVASASFAQAPATQPAPPDVSGKLGTPIQVFNGKDLTGWTWFTDQPDSKIENVWTVKDGVLHCTGRPNGYLKTEKEYGPDYILVIEYRHVTTGGGGFLFGISGPDKIWPKTMQVQGAFNNVGELVNQGTFNWFIDNERYVPQDRLRKIGPASEKPLGEWNTLEIVTDHGNLSVRVNGQLQNNAEGMDDVTGRIGFQSEGAQMEYRKVELTPILKK